MWLIRRVAGVPVYLYNERRNDRGEVAERLKALASKANVRETVPWVRIPPSPP